MSDIDLPLADGHYFLRFIRPRLTDDFDPRDGKLPTWVATGNPIRLEDYIAEGQTVRGVLTSLPLLWRILTFPETAVASRPGG